jgi:hypothetical protein
MKEPAVIYVKVPSSLSVIDSSGVCKLMDCLATVFMDEFSNFFNILCLLLVLGRPERLSSSTDTQPALKMNVIQKPLSGLKNALEKPHKAFQGLW